MCKEWIGWQARQKLGLTDQLTASLTLHTSSSTLQPLGYFSSDLSAEAAFLSSIPYFRMKRSTRPSVSIIFCVPV